MTPYTHRKLPSFLHILPFANTGISSDAHCPAALTRKKACNTDKHGLAKRGSEICIRVLSRAEVYQIPGQV